MLARLQFHPVRSSSLMAATLVLLAACTAKKEATPSMAIDSAATMAAPDTAKPAAAPAINDAQIAHIAVTADAIDSAAGVYALAHASSKAVKGFAKTMVHDHSEVNRKAVALATKLGVTPEDNDVSRGLVAGADSAHTVQASLKGAAFDKAYMDREIAFHQAVIDALNSTLIPSTQNADLKALLVSARPNFVGHLALAKSVRAGLGS